MNADLRGSALSAAESQMHKHRYRLAGFMVIVAFVLYNDIARLLPQGS